MRYDMTTQEKDFFIQIVSSENFALNRGTSEDYLHAFREKMAFIEKLKIRYGIDKDAAMNIVMDSGVIITNE